MNRLPAREYARTMQLQHGRQLWPNREDELTRILYGHGHKAKLVKLRGVRSVEVRRIQSFAALKTDVDTITTDWLQLPSNYRIKMIGRRIVLISLNEPSHLMENFDTA